VFNDIASGLEAPGGLESFLTAAADKGEPALLLRYSSPPSMKSRCP